VADYLDPHGVANVLQETVADTQSYLIECDPGTSCRLGSLAISGAGGGALISGSGNALPQGMSADADYGNVGGVFDVETLTAQTGQSVRLVVPQRSPLPADGAFRVYGDDGWRNFQEDDANRVFSAPGEAGVCPPPGDSSYTPGLTEGDLCVQLLLEDGGPNDVDATANDKAAIVGGVGAAEDIVYHTDGGSGGGSMGPATLLLMLTGGLFAGLRRRRAVHGAVRGGVLLAIAALLMAPAEQVLAQEEAGASEWWRSLYMNASFAAADTNVSAGELEQRFAGVGIQADISEIDSKRSGWGVALGLPVGLGWSVEAGYQDLQQTDITFTALSTAENLGNVYPESGDGVTVSAMYEHAVGERIGLRARAGLFSWDSDFETMRLDNEELVDTSSASGTDLYWGVGASWRVADAWSVDGEYQRFEFEHDPVDYLKLGLSWHFGR
jgi:opacity protein-like surface antigen